MIIPMTQVRQLSPQSDYVLYGEVRIHGMVVDVLPAATPAGAAAWSIGVEAKLRQVFAEHLGTDVKITSVMSRNDNGSIVHKFFTDYLRDSAFCRATIVITKEPFNEC